MIDKKTLDEVLPLPEIEERRDELVAELKAAGFVITNFHSGGVFYTLLMIVLRIEREFKMFLRRFLNNAFVSHASGVLSLTWPPACPALLRRATAPSCRPGGFPPR